LANKELRQYLQNLRLSILEEYIYKQVRKIVMKVKQPEIGVPIIGLHKTCGFDG